MKMIVRYFFEWLKISQSKKVETPYTDSSPHVRVSGSGIREIFAC